MPKALIRTIDASARPDTTYRKLADGWKARIVPVELPRDRRFVEAPLRQIVGDLLRKIRGASLDDNKQLWHQGPAMTPDAFP